jgi:alpha-L-rhamnosidase
MKSNQNIVVSLLSFGFAAFIAHTALAGTGAAARFPVTDVVNDGTTVNTKAIQATIDQCAKAGGGTVIIPKGEFVSGALFLKPGVNLELVEGAVLLVSTNIADFPTLPHVRFEGHFSDHASSLLNVDGCDHFRLTGPGMLNGNGVAYWKSNYAGGRPRLCEVINSKDVVVSGVKFFNSPQWNLHFYNCQDSVAENCRFEIGPKAKGPSTDGVDIDSSANITVKGCFFNVNDDCVCLKGNRYDGLDQEPKSPPVKNILVTDCTFVRGMGAVTLGTEATVIRDVEFKNSTVSGNMPMLRLKFRPDTAGQDYANVHVHDIKLDGSGKILSLEPTHGTKVSPDKASHAKVSNVTVENITGSFGAFGKFSGAITDVRDVTLRNINVKVSGSAELISDKVVNLKLENVNVSTNSVP